MNFRTGLKGHKSMEKTDRNIKLIPLLGADFRSDPLAICGRFPTNVNTDIQDSSLRYPHQLGLGKRGNLHVQTTYGEDRFGTGVIVLNEFRGDPRFVIPLAMISLRKETPLVLETAPRNDFHV